MRLLSATFDDVNRLLVETDRDAFVLVSDVVGSEFPPARDVGDFLAGGDRFRQAIESGLAGLNPSVRRFGWPDLRLAPPVNRPGSIICVGRNYLEHIDEGAVEVPAYPLLFAKFANTLVGGGGSVPHHAITRELDYEGELAVVIGRTAQRISSSAAMTFVAGYTAINDISARDLQEQDHQWIRGKSLDGFAPCGPTFVTADAVPDVDQLHIETRINGQLRQSADSGEMLIKIPELLAFITEAITLQPGDLVATGTPAGTAIGLTPPPYLRPGDQIDVTVTAIGTLTSYIVNPDA